MVLGKSNNNNQIKEKANRHGKVHQFGPSNGIYFYCLMEYNGFARKQPPSLLSRPPFHSFTHGPNSTNLPNIPNSSGTIVFGGVNY